MKINSIRCGLWVWAVLASGVSGFAQLPPVPKAALEAMERLRFLEGEWEGGGWMEMGGQRFSFSGREQVEYKLDGLILLIEGIHHIEWPDGQRIKIHHALGNLSYDPERQAYVMIAQKHDGKMMHASGAFADGRFIWGFTDPQLGQMRFTLWLDEEGRWQETGERCSEGESWSQFLSMTFTRVKP